MYRVWKETEISAAHSLRDYGGRCENPHGHNWRLRVYVESENLDETGMVMDFVVLKKVMQEVGSELDHQDLNRVPPFDSLNPTAENIARWFFERCAERVDDGRVRVSQVRVWETASSCAVYEG
jgi:6-pyruvoyltetrahydropterin/6-carboxytetrahydropterin synthase